MQLQQWSSSLQYDSNSTTTTTKTVTSVEQPAHDDATCGLESIVE